MAMKKLPPRRSQRGAAAVELALTAGLLLLVLQGASELGRAMVQYNTVVKGTRAAVRYLAQSAAGNTTAIATAKNLVLYGSPATGTLQVPGLTAAMVSVCDATSCAGTHFAQLTGAGSVDLVTVTVTGLQFQSLFSGVIPNFTFDPIAATMRQD